MKALLVFDDVIHGTSNVYTSSRHHLALGNLETYTIQAVVEPGSTMTSLTVQVETGSDGRNWVSKNPTAEIDAVSMTSGATRTAYASDLGDRRNGALVRLRIAIAGSGTPSGHVKIFVSGAATDPKIVPGRFPGCELWLRADMGIELESVANPVVSKWRDMTMRGHDASQSTSGRRPTLRTDMINNMPSVYFDGATPGSEKYFSLASSLSGLTAAHAFLVGRNVSDAPSPAVGLWRLGGSADPTIFGDASSRLFDDFGSNTRYAQGVAVANLRTRLCYEVRAASGSWASLLNGTAQSSSGTNTVAWSGSPELGGNSASGVYYDGHVAEVVVFNRILGAHERIALVGYFNARYALGMS